MEAITVHIFSVIFISYISATWTLRSKWHLNLVGAVITTTTVSLIRF